MDRALVKRRRLLHTLMDIADRMLNQTHTMVVRGSFAAWGRGSRIGRGARLVAPHLVHVGSGVMVGEGAWLNAKDDRGDGAPTLHIGDGTYIGRLVQINAWRNVTIGRQVMIADRVFISDADHKHEDSCRPIALQGDEFIGPVILQEGCWIGIGAVILPGVTVGRNAIVAANAVVTRSIPDRSVAGGIPARIIGSEMKQSGR
jgi:acetyltransferase-like isoleucine patch superfamily enzyme